MNFPMRRVLWLPFLLLSLWVSAQNTTSQKETISKTIASYFALDRETIHLHFDKTVFFTNEEIFFKGYVYNRKNKEPYYATTNIHARLLDEGGQVVAEKLFFASNGSFLGNFTLEPTWASGHYYIQVFTNWMNNFREDETSVFPIELINTQTGRAPQRDHFADVHVEVFAEGGTWVAGVQNTIGIRVTGCDGTPFSSGQVEVVDAKGQAVAQSSVNRFGLAKVALVPENGMKVRFSSGDTSGEALFPVAEASGIAVEINNFTLPGKVIVKVRPHASLLPSLRSKPLFLVLQQDDTSTIVDVPFPDSKTEAQLVLQDSLLSEGVCVARFIDSEMKQWAERLLFRYPAARSATTVEKQATKDGVMNFEGHNFTDANLSVSAVPFDTKAYDENHDLYSTFYFQPYVRIAVPNGRYYLSKYSKGRHYELDLALLAQPGSRQAWSDITNTPPVEKFEFEKGQTIAGNLSQPLKDRGKYKIKLYSITALLQEFSDIGEKNDFAFPNMVITDSTSVKLYLVEVPGFEPKPFKYSAHIVGIKGNCLKPFRPTVSNCPLLPTPESVAMPKFAKNFVQLAETEVKNTNKLKRQDWPGHHDLSGYKVPPTATQRVTLFLETRGFNVTDDNTSITITARGVSSINGAPRTPVLYIDNMRQMSYDVLVGMTMDEIDEIYTNAHTIVPSVTNNEGVIRIYRKKPKISGPASFAQEFAVNGGFARIHDFHNPELTSTSDEGFHNFGVISWIGTLITDTSGVVRFSMPDYRTPSTLHVEGFTFDGSLICERFDVP